jgi:predicted Fe-Mo cluster-binding NifX family protein
MRVAATAEGTDLDSSVALHFARARYFLVVDLGGKESIVRSNTDLQRIPHLAGTQAAGLLIRLEVDAVFTMNIGPRAYATLKSAGVRVLQARAASVGEMIDLYQAGQLAELTGPNVEEHWSQQGRP